MALRARAAFPRQRHGPAGAASAENLQFLPLVQDAVPRDRKPAIDDRKPDGQLAGRSSMSFRA